MKNFRMIIKTLNGDTFNLDVEDVDENINVLMIKEDSGALICFPFSNILYFTSKPELVKKNQDKWIPYEDEYPDDDDEYLVTWAGKIGNIEREYNYLALLEYCKGEWVTDEIKKQGYHDIRITAWMPLPDRYREDTE